jgi:hypothetical protein
MTPRDVARIVERRDEDAFVDLLRAADPEFEDAAFESAIADALRSNPPLIDQWNMWSGDQRRTPTPLATAPTCCTWRGESTSAIAASFELP